MQFSHWRDPLRYHKQLRWLVATIALLTSAIAVADRAPYGETINLEAPGETLMIRHHHDWSKVMLSSDELIRYTLAEPFGIGNDYSYISAHTPDGAAELWRVPSPPLTWLGFSPDGRYIIGLSHIKLANNTQLAVFDVYGKLMGRAAVVGYGCVPRAKRDAEIAKKPEPQRAVWAAFSPACLPNVGTFSETVSNFIRWYDTRDPAPRVIEESGRAIAVELNDRTGAKMRVPFDSGPIVK